MNADCPHDLALRLQAATGRRADEIASDLERYFQTLIKWQAAKNLVSRETLSEFWTRHVADSVQLYSHVPAQASNIFDLGSGGGFPGIPLAICFSGSGRQVTLIEANGRKVAFLKAVARELQVSVRVLAERIEQIDSRETGKADVITARALAPLAKLLGYASPILDDGGVALFHKGREYVEELAEAGATWTFDVVVIDSETSAEGVVLKISNVAPKAGQHFS